MAQTLIELTSLSNPPTLSESNAFQANVSKLVNLSDRQLLCVRIWAKVAELVALSGTDYSADLPLLVSSSQNLFGQAYNVTQNPTSGDISAKWEAVLDWGEGYNADNTLETDVETILENTQLLAQYPEATLYQIVLFLRYKLALLIS